MRSLPSPKLLALPGAALILIALFFAGRSAFHRSAQDGLSQIAHKTVGLELSEAPILPCMAPAAPRQTMSDSPLELPPQKRIRTARLSLEVKDCPRFEAACRALGARLGYMAEMKASTDDDGRKRAELTLRIQAERFDTALAEFKALGTVKHEEMKVEDVTRAYADLEARRANKRTAAVRLREIIATRTGKLSDVIEAEQALSQVTEELESMEAQKRTLDSQIAYSTLQAEVFEPARPRRFAEPRLWEPLVGALKDGRSGLIASLAFVTEALIVLSPWILIGALTFWLLRRWRAAHPRIATLLESAEP